MPPGQDLHYIQMYPWQHIIAVGYTLDDLDHEICCRSRPARCLETYFRHDIQHHRGRCSGTSSKLGRAKKKLTNCRALFSSELPKYRWLRLWFVAVARLISFTIGHLRQIWLGWGFLQSIFPYIRNPNPRQKKKCPVGATKKRDRKWRFLYPQVFLGWVKKKKSVGLVWLCSERSNFWFTC